MERDWVLKLDKTQQRIIQTRFKLGNAPLPSACAIRISSQRMLDKALVKIM